MQATTFSFGGISCEKYGIMICTFGQSGKTTSSMGSEISFTTTKAPLSKTWNAHSSNYKSPVSFSIDLCNSDFSEITVDKQEEINMWLNIPNEYEWFCFDQEDYDDIYFKVKCTSLTTISYNNVVMGISASFEANAPFGFTSLRNITYNITSGDVKRFANHSSEYGALYPEKIVINMKSDGDFILHNSIEDRTTKIKNCINGETITIENSEGQQYMFSDKVVHDNAIYDDFNLVMPRFFNTRTEKVNVLTFTGDCTIKFYYRFVRKVGVA